MGLHGDTLRREEQRRVESLLTIVQFLEQSYCLPQSFEYFRHSLIERLQGSTSTLVPRGAINTHRPAGADYHRGETTASPTTSTSSRTLARSRKPEPSCAGHSKLTARGRLATDGIIKTK